MTDARTPAPKPLAEYPELMTADEVADYLGLTAPALYRRLKQGTVPLEPIMPEGRKLFSRYQVARLVRGDEPS